MFTAPRTIADTACICFTKAMNRPLTGGTVEAAAKPWLIKSAPPAIPFDTPVPGMPRTSAVDNARGNDNYNDNVHDNDDETKNKN